MIEISGIAFPIYRGVRLFLIYFFYSGGCFLLFFELVSVGNRKGIKQAFPVLTADSAFQAKAEFFGKADRTNVVFINNSCDVLDIKLFLCIGEDCSNAFHGIAASPEAAVKQIAEFKFASFFQTFVFNSAAPNQFFGRSFKTPQMPYP